MKKYIALIITGAMLCGLCSCGDKPDVSEPDGDVTTAAVTEAEPEYLELTEADFTPVDIQSDIIEDMPHAEISSADLSGLSFGERMSPCKADDISADYEFHPYNSPDGPMDEEYEAERSRILSTPSKGFVDKGLFIGSKLYLVVNFDDWCGNHDSSIYCYDTENGECRELVTHTGLEYDDSFTGLRAIHGKPMYRVEAPDEENGGIKTTICSIDPDSGAEETVCELGGWVQYVEESEKGFILCVDEGGENMGIKEFDLSTKEMSDFQIQEQNADMIRPPVAYCDGVPAEITGGFDGEKNTKITVKTQYYTVETDLNYYSKIMLWKDKFCIACFEDISGKWLYTYDIANHERLKMKFDGFSYSELTQTNDAIVALVSSNDFSGSGESVMKVYYIVPTLGTIYRIGEAGEYISGLSDGTAYILLLDRMKNSSYPLNIGYNLLGQYKPAKLFWFETPQTSVPISTWW